jgi:4-hydroxy-tetrahydrodipicolinate synthase
LQDYSLATQVQIPAEVILSILEALPNCVMLKHEDRPGLAKISTLRAARDRGARRISIPTGNGGLFLPEELERGADAR